jgi:hypothetical protein
MTAKRLDQAADLLETGSASDPNTPASPGINDIGDTQRTEDDEVSADANFFQVLYPNLWVR